MPPLTTNVPPVTFGPNGFIAPLDSAILSGCQADVNAAFGGGLNPALNTPQGQIATTNAACTSNADQTFCYYTNQVDPAYASGRMQDAIGRIYFLTRLPALPTVLQVSCTGLNGVVIPVNALITDTAGNTYTNTNAVMIPVGGSVTAQFANLLPGPIAVPNTDDVSILTAIPGWDTVTCTSGTIGQNVESRTAFEERRAATVAGNSFGPIGAVIGAVAKVSGVLDYYGYSNNTAAPVTVLGVTIPAYAMYIAVAGGAETDIAQAILSKLNPGPPMSGNTTVTAYDSNPLYSAPIPYTIKFNINPGLQILFAVNIVSSPLVPSNAATLIQTAIINAFAGNDGGPRARIGALLLASRYVAPIAALGAWAQIRSLFIGSNNDADLVTFTAAISGTTLTVGSVSSGTLAIGQTLSDAAGHIPEGVRIVSGSGSSWVLNTSLTVTSETMYAAAAIEDETQVNANQTPSVAAANIVVTVS